MSTGQGQVAAAAPTTWTEPPWCGWIETTGDALLILEAARRGLIPRVTRRLVDSERKMITSGSVFVFDEDESGIKRWTDGFFWSPSRILGNFLLYRETDKKSSGRGRGADVSDLGDEGNSLSRPKDGSQVGTEKLRERNLMGSLTNNYKFKSDGLMKKTFSLTIGGVAQHLISYYRVEDVENGRLRSPSSLPELASLSISPEYLDKTHFRNPPKVEVGPDGVPRYRGEADDVEIGTRAPVLSTPLSGLPLLTEGRVTESGKRSKRYEPYGGPAPKRQRKQKANTQGEQEGSVSPVGSASTTEQLASPTQSTTTPTVQSPPPQTYQEHTSTAAQPVPVYHQYNPCYPPAFHPYPYPQPANPPSSPAAFVSGQQQQLPASSSSTTATYPVTGAVVTYHYDPNGGPSQQQQPQHQQAGYPYYHPPPTGAYPYVWHPAYGGYNPHHQVPATPHQHAGVHAHVQSNVDESSDDKAVNVATSGGVEG